MNSPMNVKLWRWVTQNYAAARPFFKLHIQRVISHNILSYSKIQTFSRPVTFILLCLLLHARYRARYDALRRGVKEVFALAGFYTARVRGWLSVLRGGLSVPCSRVKQSAINKGKTLENGIDRLAETSV